MLGFSGNLPIQLAAEVIYRNGPTSRPPRPHCLNPFGNRDVYILRGGGREKAPSSGATGFIRDGWLKLVKVF